MIFEHGDRDSGNEVNCDKAHYTADSDRADKEIIRHDFKLSRPRLV